jgi:hypothetical protein
MSIGLTSAPTHGIVRCVLVWLALLLVTTGMAALFGVSLLAALAYAAYVALFIILPGVVHYGLASRSTQVSFVFAAKATVVGQCVEMLAGLLANMTGAHALYPFLPLLYLAELVFWRRRILVNIEGDEGGPKILPLVIGLVVTLFLVFAASLFGFHGRVDQHFTWIAAFSNVAVTQWPIHEPFLMDVPLHYHYLFNIHVGTAARTFGIPLILVASRLAIIFHGFLFVLMLHAFCQSRFRAGWLGTLAAVQVLLTFGFSAVMWPYFHLATPLIIFQLASTAVAFEIFLVLCDEILGPSGRGSQRPYALIVFLMLMASGTRANLLPMLCGGIGLLLLAHVRQGHERVAYAGLLGAAMLAIFTGAVFFLGLGDGDSNGTSLLFIRPLNVAVSEVQKGEYAPLVQTLLAAGLPTSLTAIAYLLVAILGRLTFLLPGAIFALVATDIGIERNLRVMLGGVALAGIGLLVLIEAVVPQEIWAFYWYADIGFALLGAAGLRALWQRRVTQPVLAGGALLASTLLFALQLWDFSTGFAQTLSVTRLPTPAPVFETAPGFEELVQTLEQHVVPGDVLVTGGNVGILDDRVLPAAVPGLQLYASRIVLPIYEARVNVDPRVASRLWLIRDNLSNPAARATIRTDVGPSRALYLLWLGPSAPPYRTGLSAVGSWPLMSLWRVEFEQPGPVEMALLDRFPCAQTAKWLTSWINRPDIHPYRPDAPARLSVLLQGLEAKPADQCFAESEDVLRALDLDWRPAHPPPEKARCAADLALAGTYHDEVFDERLRGATVGVLERALAASMDGDVSTCLVATAELRDAYRQAIGVSVPHRVPLAERIAGVRGARLGLGYPVGDAAAAMLARFPCREANAWLIHWIDRPDLLPRSADTQSRLGYLLQGLAAKPGDQCFAGVEAVSGILGLEGLLKTPPPQATCKVDLAYAAALLDRGLDAASANVERAVFTQAVADYQAGREAECLIDTAAFRAEYRRKIAQAVLVNP